MCSWLGVKAEEEGPFGMLGRALASILTLASEDNGMAFSLFHSKFPGTDEPE